jgi:hypothetical protein
MLLNINNYTLSHHICIIPSYVIFEGFYIINGIFSLENVTGHIFLSCVHVYKLL